MTCYILEDEPLALENLMDYIEQLPSLEVVGFQRDPVLAIDEINRLKPNVLFLDINMPKLNGLEVLDNLIAQPLVVFTTAYDEYALTSYQYEAVDYLLKPFRLSRLVTCIQKLEKRLLINERQEPVDENIILRDGRKHHVVKKSELIYVKSDRDYLEYHLTNRLIVAIGTLRKEEERLKEKGFLRVHHSYLVNLSAMKHFTPKSINVGEVEIPIGRAYKAAVLKQIEEQG